MKRFGKTILMLGVLSSLFLVIYTSCQKELSCENCIEVNKPPIAKAGNDTTIVLPVDSVVLDGTKSSDPDDGIAAYKWAKISGSDSAILQSPASVRTVANRLVKSEYLFELTVTDKGGLSAKDTVKVIVDPRTVINRPPLANAGNDTSITMPANSVNLNGIWSSDPDNNISSYVWTQLSGPTASNIINANAVQTKVANLEPGTYSFELKVTDIGGLFSSDTMYVNVLEVTNVIPRGRAEMIITLPIDSVWIDDWVRADESYQWIKIAGPASGTVKYQNVPRTLIEGLVPGTYTFLKVPYSFTGPADTIDVIVIDDPNDPNTITYKNLFWEYSHVTNNDTVSLSLWKPFWQHNSNLTIEVSIQMSFVNNGQWFKLPSTQDGINYRVDCSPYPNCLWGLLIRPTPEDLNLLNNKPCNLKLKIL
jgi:chitodextrinase